MWFDARLALAQIAAEAFPVSQMSQVSQAPEARQPALGVANVAVVATSPDLILDLCEERAAIREYLGGQSRAEAEAAAVADVARSTGCAPLRVLRIVGGGNG